MFYSKVAAVKGRNGRELASVGRTDMSENSKVPGACSDCGNDAYIQLGGEDGSAEMVCAHCFVDRARTGKLVDAKRPPGRTAARTSVRTERLS